MRVDGKPEGLRQSMSWLHTWSGLLLGWLLYAVFFTGTLSFFRNEITDWMRPELHQSVPDAGTAQRGLDAMQAIAPKATTWTLSLPNERQTAIEASWREPGAAAGRPGTQRTTLDAGTGEQLQPRETRGGAFLYRFHFELYAMPRIWGRWIVGFATMLMLVAIISGVITHKKIFSDFFTFRPRKGQRSWLDGHNAVGVLVLPFHLMITYSSLVIFMSMVMPASIVASYGSDVRKFYDDVFPASKTPERADVAAPLTAMAPLLAKASEQWAGGHTARLSVSNPGDASATVVLSRAGDRVVHDFGRAVTFSGVTGQLLSSTPDQPVAMAVGGAFYGLHMGHFAGPLLRWLYFICGLAGTAMIGTGLVIWLGKRQLKNSKSAALPFELRLVEVLNIASMAGLVSAVAVFFLANRLLPVSLAGRADWEVNAFFIAWGLSVVHAVLRPGRKAWIEQLTLGAALFIAVPLINALTTPWNLGASLMQRDWALAGFDLTCLATGLFLGWAARKMQRTGDSVSVRKTSSSARSITVEQGAN